MITPHIYIISYNNGERLNKMLNRFKELDLPEPRIPNPVHLTDVRLRSINAKEPRTWSIMLQHLDALNHFYLSSNSSKINEKSKEYCIICEDDILISKKIKKNLPDIVKKFHKLNLDVLLLGYLTTNPLAIEGMNDIMYKHVEEHRLYKYPDDQWGSQMYIVSREQAQYLINTYTIEWALNNLDKPYSPDWIITKKGNCALIYPPLAVEDGNTLTDHEGQKIFHRESYNVQYKENEYI